MVPFIDPLGKRGLTIPPVSGNFLGLIGSFNRISTVSSPAVFVEAPSTPSRSWTTSSGARSACACTPTRTACWRNADVSSLRDYPLRTRFFDESGITGVHRHPPVPARRRSHAPGVALRIYDVVRRQQPSPSATTTSRAHSEDDAGRAKAALRASAKASHLARSGLSRAEFLFLREGISGASFVRGGELLMPNPWRRYGNGQRLGRVLRGLQPGGPVEGRNRIRVTYEIYEDRQGVRARAWDRLGRFMAGFVGHRRRRDRPIVQSLEHFGPRPYAPRSAWPSTSTRYPKAVPAVGDRSRI